MSVDSVYGFLGNRYVLPPGSILEVGPESGMNAVTVKLITGGTLEIGGSNSSSSLSFVGFTAIAGAIENQTSVGQTFGVLYPLSANEVYAGNLAGRMRMYASGATCVVTVAIGRSQGY